MEEKPVAPAAGNHRRASREAEKVLLARALDARRLPVRALAVRVPLAKAVVASAQPESRVDERRSVLLLHARRAEESSLSRAARL